MPFTAFGRRGRLALLLSLVSITLAACGGGSASPTPTSVPPPKVSPTTAGTAPSPARNASPSASPAASPVGSPAAGATPVGSQSGGTPLTRAQFQQQLLQKYPMEPAAHKGGSIIMGEAGDISTLNGILANDSTTLNIVGTIFEPLVGVSPVDGSLVPGLADSWDVSPDQITYTFHLNTAARWQDGVDFTADDVKFSFDAVLDPNTGSAYTSSVNDAVASYRVIDADTFEITAKDRLVTFYYDAPGSVLLMPKHIWESVGFESWTFDGGSTGQDASRVIGTGPFKFQEWDQGDHVTVVRNDAYYDIVPNIDALTMQILPDAEAATLSLKQGQTDIMQIIPAPQTQSVIDTPGRKVEIYDFSQITFYAMNLDPEKTPYFVDPLVRQALYTGLDRNAITEQLFLGFGEAAVGTQPNLSPAYAPDRMSPPFTFDPEAARQLLAQAGWTDSNNNGTVDHDGKELSFKMLYVSGDATVDSLVANMQDQWKAIGVKMEPDGVQFNAFSDGLEKHDFDTVLIAFGLSPDGSQGLLFSCKAYTTGFNYWKYCNPEWDALDDQQRREFDPQKRAELLIQQSQMIWQDQPIGPIRFGVARTGYSARIHNFYPNGFGFLWSLPYMWVDAS